MEEPNPAALQAGSQTLPPGVCLEGLVIKSLLGSSPFSNTYLAKDIELEKLFVLKEHCPRALCYRDPRSFIVLPRADLADHYAWSVENFQEEAEALIQLSHPGIVRVLGEFESFGTSYLAMPYIEGASLQEQIDIRHAHGPEFNGEELNGLLWRMLEALNYLHDRGIFHLGVRPENILLNEEGVPSLVGFSDARRRLCLRTSLKIEKTGYTPLEQTIPDGKVGPQTDVFALGSTLFTAITGKPPAVATPIPLTRRLQLRDRYPHSLLDSIDQALKPTLEDRFCDGKAWRTAIWGEIFEIEPETDPAEERAEQERAEQERTEQERIEKERVAQERAEQQRVEQERAEQERIENERLEKERSEKERVEKERVEKERAEKERAEKERAALLPATSVDPFDQLLAAERPFSILRFAISLILIGILALVIVAYVFRADSPSLPETVTAKPEKKPLSTVPAFTAPIVPTSSTPEPAAPEPLAGLPPLTGPADSPEGAATPPAMRPSVAPIEVEGGEAGEVRVFGGIEMVWCPPGTFSMGSPWNEKGRFIDETPHQVVLTRGFWIAKTETTQAQWELLALDNPSWRKGENLPVEKLSWSEVQLWLEKKNAQDPLPDGWKWSLPTEAQWEYACRAGSTTAIYSGPMEILGALNAPALDEIAWYGGNSSVGYSGAGMDTSGWKEKQFPGGPAGEREVAGKLPNAWGLHDMIGNVWEWCADWMAPYEIGTVIDPKGPATGTERAMRGGSWANGPDLCRSAARNGNPGEGGDGLGFRPVIVPSGGPEK